MNPKPTSPKLESSSKNAAELSGAMRADQRRLKKSKRKLTESEFAERLQDSVERRRRREAYQPKLEYPEDLPISGYREELVHLIQQRQVIVVCGETGSGKSTQLPKLCLEAGRGREAMIGHTQPRRLAARSIADRLADEMGCGLGEQVGYQVRFGDQTGPDTMVKLMTDGILLAETASDRLLEQYDTIIIDEAHERSLNIDFLLAYLKQLLTKRDDLKLIITSATIDAERFAEHFSDQLGNAPIFRVEGRGYPVEIRNLAWEDVSGDSFRHPDLSIHVIEAIKQLSRDGTGDCLVFLPTERDIRVVSHRVAGHYKRMGLEGRFEVLPLYARLPQKDQQRIFQPTGRKQRLIFATNVAESSLTVPGIRYVIDSGTARISRYSPRSKLQRLPIEPVSRASADQRAGRCGRVGPGICVRLYSAEDYESREAFTTPEIRRTNLASVVLQAKMLGFANLEALPLLDVPRPESIREGIQTLRELGATDETQELTETGRTLGRLPVDPRIGRMILAAEEYGALPEVLPIAAALELPDPRQRPPEKQQAADEAHAEFRDSQSDFISLLRLWRYYENLRAEVSRNRLTKELRKRFLSPTRMREWSDVYRQLRETAAKITSKRTGALAKIRYQDDGEHLVGRDVYAAIHKSLLAGLLSGVAMASDKNEYSGPRNLKLFLWPGSGVFDSKPKWIVAAELVETARQYARTVARIQPQWIEQVGAHLLKASYSDPHWSTKSSGAFCYQRLSLFGLPVVVRRRVPLAPVDPATSRDLLIEHGLVQRELRTNARFVRHNREIRDSIAQLAAKTRRRDLVVDDYVVLQIYHQRLPKDVVDRGRLEKFAKTLVPPEWANRYQSAASVSSVLSLEQAKAKEGPMSLFFRPSDLLEADSEAISAEAYPNELKIGRSEMPLRYRYEPGAEDDGVAIRVHEAAVAQVSDDRLGWLVPGLLKQKITALIKSLPKRLRRNLVPAAEVAEKIYQDLLPKFGQVPFAEAVCAEMSRQAEMPIRRDDFQLEKLDAHFEFLVEVVDDAGDVLAASRSVTPLLKRFASRQESATQPQESTPDLPTGKLVKVPETELPREVVRERGGVNVAQYPAFADHRDHVRVALMSDADSASAVHASGVMRFFQLAEFKELRKQVRWLPDWEATKLKLAGSVPTGSLESSLIDLLSRIAFVENEAEIRSLASFESRRENRMERISIATQEVASWLTELGGRAMQLRSALESFPKQQFAAAHADLCSCREGLFHTEFLSVTPWNWLKHYPRYLHALVYRIDKLQSGGGQRDAQSTQVISDLIEKWTPTLPEDRRDIHQNSHSEFRWMIEELRVSLFAQPLGTSIKISPKRCEKQLEQMQRS